MATAHWVSRLLYVAAQMNLADRLAEGPMTAEELAPSTATDAPSLHRMMRTLASLGLFTEDPGTGFFEVLGRGAQDRHTRLSACVWPLQNFDPAVNVGNYLR